MILFILINKMGNECFKKNIEKYIEYKYNYKNIKSKYILQKLFNNLEKKKALDILKYNKNVKIE